MDTFKYFGLMLNFIKEFLRRRSYEVVLKHFISLPEQFHAQPCIYIIYISSCL